MFDVNTIFFNTILLLFPIYSFTYLYLFSQRKKWDTFTRVISTFNALQCILMVVNVIKNELLQSEIFSLYYSPTNYYTNSLFVFAAYLFVDGVFQLPDLYTNFSYGLVLSIAHHLVGCYGIYLIAVTRLGFFLGFYFAMTEISTPLLNLSWYYRNDAFFVLFYVLFLMYRITTIPVLVKYLLDNTSEIYKLDHIRIFMSFFGSYTLILLNIIWFVFITQKVLEMSKKYN